MSRHRSLICLALTHTLVDTCALMIAPLWPVLKDKFAFGVAGLSLAFIVQSLPTSLSQAVFGYLRDRKATPFWIWLGPVMAAVFLPLVGVVSQTTSLYAIFVLGGIGVGAFHPEAAVTAGRLMPEQRTRALSLFMFGGALGLGLGPTLGGFVVTRWGLEGLSVLILPILLLIALLQWVGRIPNTSAVTKDATSNQTIGGMLAGRVHLAVFLFIICSLRLVPNMAVDKVLSFTLQRRGFDEQQIGLYQTLFLVSASVGMFLMVLRFRSGWEKRFMVACPLAGIPMLYVLGMEECPEWLFRSSLVLGGMVLWGTTPAMVSYAQQLFPKGAGIASAITMGLSWGLGGLIQAPLTSYFESTGVPQHAFYAFIPCMILAALGASYLPTPSVQTASRADKDETHHDPQPYRPPAEAEIAPEMRG